MANRNWASGGRIYSMHVSPVLLDCNFVVDSTQVNGISSLKGPAVTAVYMHSSHATPSALNPAVGNIVVQLADNYNRNFTILNARASALSGSGLTSTTAHTAYVITDLGTATAAEWLAAGVPAGIEPAVGVSFIALATGSIGGSAEVQIADTLGSGVAAIEILGDPSLMCSPDPTAAQGYGASAILQCRDYAGALVAPVDGTVISISLYMSNSSVQVAGE